MALTSTARSITYACNGTQTEFAVPFQFHEDEDLIVTAITSAGVESVRVLGINYTVATEDDHTGAVTFLVAPRSGSTVRLEREVALTQDTVLRGSGPFRPETIEQALDRQTMMTQQLDARVTALDDGAAATEAYVQTYVAGVIDAGEAVLPEEWNLTGDGSSTSFTITGADAASNVSYFVYISGLMKRPAIDYTVNQAAGSITFSTAPAAGAVIYVRQVAYAHAYSAADNSSITATGSTTARTLAARAAEWFNVKDYGAVGNGIADDVIPIQAAINAASASGGTVLMPAGDYSISSALNLAAGVTLRGMARTTTSAYAVETIFGTIIIPSADVNCIEIGSLVTGSGGAAVENLAFHYPSITLASSSTPSTGIAISIAAASAAAYVNFGVTIRNVEVIGFRVGIRTRWVSGGSIDAANTKNLLIEDVHFARCDVGLLLNALGSSTIRNVSCDRLFGRDLSTLQTYLSGAAGTLATSAQVGQNLIQSRGQVVVDGLRVYDGTGTGLLVQDSTDITLRGCYFSAATTHNLMLCGVNRMTIRDTDFFGATETGIRIYQSTQGVGDLVIAGCRILVNGTHGIGITTSGGLTVENVDISDCMIVNNSAGSSGTYDGINASTGDVLSLRVRGGRISGSHRYALANGGVGNYWKLSDVYLAGNVTGTVLWTGTAYLDTHGCQGLNGLGPGITTPSIPATAAIGDAVANSTGVPVIVTARNLSGGNMNVYIIDRAGTSAVVAPAVQSTQLWTGRLSHGESIWFDTNVPVQWKWCGE